MSEATVEENVLAEAKGCSRSLSVISDDSESGEVILNYSPLL